MKGHYTSESRLKRFQQLAYPGSFSLVRFSNWPKIAPQAGQIIASKLTRLISFGLTTRPHFGQVVFSEVSTLSQSIFLVIAEKSSSSPRR